MGQQRSNTCLGQYAARRPRFWGGGAATDVHAAVAGVAARQVQRVAHGRNEQAGEGHGRRPRAGRVRVRWQILPHWRRDGHRSSRRRSAWWRRSGCSGSAAVGSLTWRSSTSGRSRPTISACQQGWPTRRDATSKRCARAGASHLPSGERRDPGPAAPRATPGKHLERGGGLRCDAGMLREAMQSESEPRRWGFPRQAVGA